jgi:two-component system, NtrC family, sensor kinase
MRALKRVWEVPVRVDGSLGGLLAQFSATAIELNPSLGPTEFARRLTARAAEMIGARAAVLVLSHGRLNQWEIAADAGETGCLEGGVRQHFASVLAKRAGASADPVCFGTSAELLGAELAEAVQWREIVIAKLAGSDDRLLGVLCLADFDRELTLTGEKLLEALAGHASVALENVRLFSRIERSRKQWVEDIDAISDFIVVHDNAGRVLRLNRAIADVLDARPAEMIGRSIAKLGLLGSSTQLDRCPFCRSSQAAHEEFVHCAGERTYLVSTSRLVGDDEETRTVHVLKDITDHREAERRYRRERDFNRNILNNTQSMILVLDTAGLISYANRRCFEAGYREQDLLGRPLAEMVSGSRRAAFEEALERTLQGSALESIEIPVTRGNCAARQFSVRLSPMRDEHGDINSIVVVMADITDAADLQAKLMHTEKMAALGQLVSGVAHEVNNPLAAIIGFTDLLLENRAISGEAKEDLKIILQEAQRTRVIVQNLLSFARQMPAQREPVQVNSVLRQTLKLRAYDFSNHGVEIAESYPEELPLTVGDPHQLQQVFLNILNNAYDAIQDVDRPGKIEIATSRRGGQIEIAFRDNGPGISHPERIFDPFFTTKDVGKGTGLGLSICYGIVRAHHGEISACNNADGAGCTFLVRLPVVTAAAEFLAAEAAGQ